MNTIPASAAAPEQPTPAAVDAMLDALTALMPADTITAAAQLATRLETAFANLAETLERAVHLATLYEDAARIVARQYTARHPAATAANILQVFDDVTGIGRLETVLAYIEDAATVDTVQDRIDFADLAPGDRVRIRRAEWIYSGRSGGEYVFTRAHARPDSPPPETLTLPVDDCAHVPATLTGRANTTEAGR